MNRGINLAVRKKRVETIFRKAFLATVVVFIVSVAISLILIAYRLVLKTTADSLDTKEQQLDQQLLSMVLKKDKYLETKSRIGDIKKLISQRPPIVSRVDTVTSVIPSDSSINSLSGDEKQLNIKIDTDNLSSLNDLIEQRISELASDTKKRIGKVEMQSFSLDPKSLKYAISFSVTFK